jgi:glutathione S-transferase
MIEIWGRTDSFNLQKVMWCVAELGVPHVRMDAGGKFGVTDKPAYLAMNPNGRVPTISDDGYILWESNAIIRYLSARYGMGGMCPQDLQKRGDADRWMTWQAATVGPNMREIGIRLVRTPPEARDPEAATPLIEIAAAHWAILNDQLADRDFVTGATLTMGDIPMGTYALRWFSFPIERPSLPHLEAWYARLRQRPAYRSHVMLED